MAFKARFAGRDTVMQRLRDLVPEAEKEIAAAQLEAAQELAAEIAPRAPVEDGDYRRSIRGGRLADNPGSEMVGLRKTKDPNATGIFASYKWRWIEFGTKERFRKNGASSGVMPRKPHIFPTWRAKRKAIRRKIGNALRRAIKRSKG